VSARDGLQHIHQFTAAGLLREVVIAPGRSYFDTNIDEHPSFFCESSACWQDIAGQGCNGPWHPGAPFGTEVSRIEIVVSSAST